MLFDERVKNRRADMYDRDKEIGDLCNYIENREPGIVIKGRRRVGKTSILKTALNESGKPYVYVDLRELDVKENVSRKAIISAFQDSMVEFLDKNRAGKEKLMNSLKNISGVTIMGNGVQFGWQKGREVNLAQMFKKLNNWAKENGDSIIIIAIDEAQILGQSTHYDVAGTLATIYDHCRNLIIILTGSAFKLLDKFMGTDDPKSYLYGRDFVAMYVPRLSKDQSMELLRIGFGELKGGFENDPSFDDIVDEAASKLGGIMGWLVLFGARCRRQGKISKTDIRAIQERGAELAGQEFKTFLRPRRRGTQRYWVIMKLVAKSPRTWTEIKGMLAKKTGNISDHNTALLIKTLVDNGFLDHNKETKRYAVPDPLLEFFFRQ